MHTGINFEISFYKYDDNPVPNLLSNSESDSDICDIYHYFDSDASGSCKYSGGADKNDVQQLLLSGHQVRYVQYSF